MKKYLPFSHYFFCIAIAAFGMIQFVTHNFLTSLLPMPANIPGRLFVVYFTGAVFVVAGLCIFIIRMRRFASLALIFIFSVLFLFPHLPKLISNLHNGGEWTVAFETLALCGGAFILASTFFKEARMRLLTIGKYLFALSLVVFGILHFVYEDYIMTLMPSWVPGHIYFSYIIKFGFILTALSIFCNLYVRVFTTLLGLMFMIWVIILHAPRVIGSPDLEPEWTSLFIAWAMSSISFMLSEKVSAGHGLRN